MNNNLFSFFILPVLVFSIALIVRFIRNKIYKPKYEGKVQKPGTLQQWIVRLLIFLVGFSLILATVGVFTRELEMALVFGGLAFIFLISVIFLKREYNISYQENDEYFILKAKDKEYQVYYEDIIDWQPSLNEIKILDKTKPDREYIRVNIALFKPEILLRKIVEMAFAGKFKHSEQVDTEDPNREAETVYYLINNQYGYLVDDYVKQIEK